MSPAIVTDEISLDLHTGVEVLNEFQMRDVEIRRLGLDYAIHADARWLAVAEKAVLTKKIRVVSLNSGFFDEIGAADPQLIGRLFEIAKRLRCTRISIAGPRPVPLVAGMAADSIDVTPEILDAEADEFEEDADDELDDLEEAVEAPVSPVWIARIKKLAEEAARHSCDLVLRNSNETEIGTAAEALAVIEAVDQPNLGLDWDIAAGLAAGSGSGLDMIDEVLPKLKSVHVRDAVRKGLGAEWASLGKGVIPWEDILEQLQEAKFRGALILDPGFAKLKESRLAIPQLLRWLEASKFRSRKPSAPPREGRKGSRPDWD